MKLLLTLVQRWIRLRFTDYGSVQKDHYISFQISHIRNIRFLIRVFSYFENPPIFETKAAIHTI